MRLAALLLVLAAGCRTPCQRLCVRMADYAADCGLSVPEAQLDACLDAMSGERDCSADAATLRQEWTCDDLAAFFAD